METQLVALYLRRINETNIKPSFLTRARLKVVLWLDRLLACEVRLD